MIAVLACAIAVAVVAGVVTEGSTAGGSGATIKTRSTSLGTILVDSKGRTLYLWRKDRNGKSACSGACAGAWPPVLTSGSPKAAGKAKSSQLGTTTRSNGKKQVTYKRHPLYRFAGDANKAGRTSGQGSNGFGAKWYVVAPSGNAIDND
jgi:predicted lipoprotein with Yx(FWY)xxD motif